MLSAVLNKSTYSVQTLFTRRTLWQHGTRVTFTQRCSLFSLCFALYVWQTVALVCSIVWAFTFIAQGNSSCNVWAYRVSHILRPRECFHSACYVHRDVVSAFFILPMCFANWMGTLRQGFFLREGVFCSTMLVFFCFPLVCYFFKEAQKLDLFLLTGLGADASYI